MSLFAYSTMNAVFFYNKILLKKDIAVILLGDAHYAGTIQQARTQQSEVVQIAQRLHAHCFVEDFDNPGQFNSPVLSQIKTVNTTDRSPLTNLYGILFKNNVGVTNSEFRQFSNTNKLYHDGICYEIIKKIKSCPLYKKHKTFAHYANEAIKSLYSKKYESVPYPLNQMIPEINLFDVNMFCDFYSALVNNKNNVFIFCAGAGHLEGISKIIKTVLNFNEVHESTNFKTNVLEDIYKFSKVNTIGASELKLREYAEQNSLNLRELLAPFLSQQKPMSKL